jgi:hypothetical protein
MNEEIARLMAETGSSFTRPLGEAWLAGTEDDRQRLAAAFPGLFSIYDRLHHCEGEFA